MMENHPRYCEVVWAAMRSGLYVTAINSHLTPSRPPSSLTIAEAKVLVTSAARADVAQAMVTETPGVLRRLMLDGEITGHESYEAATAAYSAEPLDNEATRHRDAVQLGHHRSSKRREVPVAHR